MYLFDVAPPVLKSTYPLFPYTQRGTQGNNSMSPRQSLNRHIHYFPTPRGEHRGTIQCRPASPKIDIFTISLPPEGNTGEQFTVAPPVLKSTYSLYNISQVSNLFFLTVNSRLDLSLQTNGLSQND
jgi:hypothetical protein